MTLPSPRTDRSAKRRTAAPVALLLGMLATVIALCAVAPSFALGALPGERRYGALFLALAASFAAQHAAIGRFARRGNSPAMVAWVLVTSAALRAPLLGSAPILEVDLYRYLWDGAAVSAGVSPYLYSPSQALAAEASDPAIDDALRRLAERRDAAPGVRRALEAVHYADLTTVYPPVSVAVFAFADRLCPVEASLERRVRVLKAILVGFDLGTLALVVGLLLRCGLPVGLGLAYGWSPLVLKEFANSGHLDSIAVFLATAAVAAVVGVTRQGVGRARPLLSAALLGLGVGAKLYPVVLAPLLLAYIASRWGFVRAGGFAVIVASVAVGSLLPMATAARGAVERGPRAQIVAAADEAPKAEPLPPPPVESAAPGEGLSTFLTRWEMNDFLFMLLVENVRPAPAGAAAAEPWFAIVPNGLRAAFCEMVAERFGTDPRTAGFLVARVGSLAVFGVVALALARGVFLAPRPRRLAHACFLNVAAFWLLAPTQNPWYWAWSMPFAAFGGSRWWLAGPAVAMAYYARFWFAELDAGAPLLGTPYGGAAFYDFVVVPALFAPWLGLIAYDAVRRRYHAAGGP